jgi:hypothetical protein
MKPRIANSTTLSPNNLAAYASQEYVQDGIPLDAGQREDREAESKSVKANGSASPYTFLPATKMQIKELVGYGVPRRIASRFTKERASQKLYYLRLKKKVSTSKQRASAPSG